MKYPFPVSFDTGEAEIGQFEVVGIVEEEVFGLEVAVEDVVGMAEGDGGDELVEEAAGLGLREAAAGGEAGEELAVFGEFEDEVDGGAGGEDLEEADDVGVAEAAHGGDLAGDVVRGQVVVAEGFRLVYDLDGHAAPGEGVAGVVDFREGAGAEEAAQLVGFEEEFGGRIRHWGGGRILLCGDFVDGVEEEIVAGGFSWSWFVVGMLVCACWGG